ncbi:MAG: ArnT family glycosyltransferase [Thermodesulfobacteriota bacterium]|jgi:4-amino-4-deoxy-L-arabinose transferase-like glycosyltransferase
MIDRTIGFFKSLNERELLLLLLAITFGIRLYAVLMAQGIAFDSAEYGFVARDFLKGHFIKGLSSPAPPFYSFLIFLFSPDTTHVEMAGRFISLFFGTLAILPLFYLIKEAIGQKEAILSALFYSFHPYLVTYSGMVLTEATYWGLFVPSVYFFWTGLKNEKVWSAMLSGLFLGLAYLTRPEGIGYVLIYLIWAVVAGGLKKRWSKRLVFIGVLILSLSIFVLPYVIYIHQETGQWLISKKAVAKQSKFLSTETGQADSSKGIEQMKTMSGESKIFWIGHNMTQFLPLVIYRYLRAYHFLLWLFLFFGLIRVRQKVIRYELFLASLVFFHLVSLSTFTPSSTRFSIPVIPLSLLWAGAGVFEMKRYLEKIRGKNAEKVVFSLVALMILCGLPQSLKPERSFRAEQKRVGLWLKQNTPQNAIIMSNSPQEAFYADREFKGLPLGISRRQNPGKSYNEIIRYAKAKGVRYILVNKNTHETNPDFIESIRSSDLREIFRRADGESIIYEVIY